MFGIFGFVMWQRANNTLRDLKWKQYQSYVDEAEKLTKDGKYLEATQKCATADSLLPDSNIARERLKLYTDVNNLLNELNKPQTSMVDSLVLQKTVYTKALELDKQNTYLQTKLDLTIRTIEAEFEAALSRYQIFLDTGSAYGRQQAIVELNTALKLKPESEEVKNLLNQLR